MKPKSDDFFLLDDPYLEIGKEKEFWRILRSSEDGRVQNYLYRPDELASPKPPKKWMLGNHTFKNFSFSRTHISYIEFTDCQFEDCLFIGSTITHCRFNNCNFVNCNFFRCEIQSCFIDPKSFDYCLDSTKHANIGMGLYQELLHNSRQQVQPEFSRNAQYQFVKWQRYWKWAKIKNSSDNDFKKCLRYFSLLPAWAFEKATGSGMKLKNLVATSILALIGLTILNYYCRSMFGLMLGQEYVQSFAEAFYFSTIVVTSLGFGDITPTTNLGRIVVAIEAIMGFITFATLVSMTFRKITS